MFITGIFAIYSIGTFYTGIFADAEFRKRSTYAVTNKRILMHYGYDSAKFKTISLKLAIPEMPPQSFYFADLPEITLAYVAKDGYGTLNFGLPALYKSFWGSRGGGSTVTIYPQFVEIENAREVYEMILDAKSKLEAKSTNID